MLRLPCLFLLAALSACAASSGGPARCMGGTVTAAPAGASGKIFTDVPEAFVFTTGSGTVRIPYDKLNNIEYGQDAGRRVLLAWVASPMFLLLKARAHYITLGFVDEEGRQQALVLRIDKKIVRSTLAALEARSGRKLSYQDADARRYYRGG